MPERNLFAILRTFSEHGAEFIVVGGLASVLHGAPVHTYDVDIVHARDPENIERVLNALTSLDALYRIQPERKIRPKAIHLAGPGHQNLLSRYGPIDVLGTIGKSLGFHELLPHAVEMDAGEGVRIRVLDLKTIISLKEELGGDKDKAQLPILRRTLEEKNKSGNQS